MKEIKMRRISQILIVLILLMELKSQMGHVMADLQNEETINENYTNAEIRKYATTITFQRPVTFQEVEKVTAISTSSAEYVSANSNLVKEANVDNKSLEYLIEEPNSNSNSSHEQEVIIKPLEEASVNLEAKFNSHQQISADLKNYSKQSLVEDSVGQMRILQISNTTQNLLIESTILQNNITEAQTEEATTPSSQEKKEELIINLLDESIASSNTSEHQRSTISVKQSNKLLEERLIEESSMTSIKIRIKALNKILKFLINDHEKPTAIGHQSAETPNKVSVNNTYENKKDSTVNTEKEAKTTSTTDHELVTMPTVSQNEEFSLKSEEQNATPNAGVSIILERNHTNIKNNPTMSLVQTVISSSSSSESEEDTKLRTTLEDYAVKQMNFILDHILLESQEFVAKVLQATGNTIFQRDHLKRYAESLNRLLNPTQLDSSYNDDILDTNPTNQEDLYEEVVQKLNFLKSKTAKQLQKHLPTDWVKDYKDKREELKIWLNKASAEMHREFNLYLDDEEDHIKYLYFNEAFDDISRATEIHQKLALLADLIERVKNKKQITFMDLYMQ